MATILIADDNSASRQVLSMLLKREKHHLLEAPNGAEALALARANHPDLIITDILMPIVDGYEFVRQMRTEPDIVDTPVIFYTGNYLDEEAQSLAESCGVYQMVSKPAPREVILQAIEEALHGTIAPSGSLLQESFDRQHLRLLTDKLAKQVEELELEIEERKRNQEQIKRQFERLTALRAIDIAISSSFDLRSTLHIVLNQASALLEIHAAAILLLNPSSQTLEYAAGHGFRTDIITHSTLYLGQGLAGRAIQERTLHCIPNLLDSKEAFERTQLRISEGILGYCVVPLLAKGKVVGVLEVFQRDPLLLDPEWLEFLETLAGQAAIAIDNDLLFRDLQRTNAELILAYDATLEGWIRALDLRDKETEGHTQRVTELTGQLAQAIGMGAEVQAEVRRGALLHDIGKLGIPDQILLKPGKLTPEEWQIMRMHPVYAYEWLAPIAYLRSALDIPYCHHEKWDGSGYPRGLKGKEIPLSARLFAVVDVWDALISDRPYRSGWPKEKAKEYLQASAGAHFDPEAVEAFLPIIENR